MGSKKRLIAYIEQLNKKECIPYQITDGAGLKKHVVINEEWQDFFMDNFVTISGWIEVKKYGICKEKSWCTGDNL